jgi:hypothetical protein
MNRTNHTDPAEVMGLKASLIVTPINQMVEPQN